MDRKQKILRLAGRLGIIRPRDVEAEGIPREYLYRLCTSGHLVRIGGGLYALPDALRSEAITLAEVDKRVPNAVVSLLSAIQFHDLTTQVLHRVWIAIENRRWEPKFDYPPIELVRLTGRAFSFGVEEHEMDRVPVKVYSSAKAFADCFKFRNRIALDVALEALRRIWISRKPRMDELWEAAKVCRVANVMRPCLEAITFPSKLQQARYFSHAQAVSK